MSFYNFVYCKNPRQNSKQWTLLRMVLGAGGTTHFAVHKVFSLYHVLFQLGGRQLDLKTRCCEPHCPELCLRSPGFHLVGILLLPSLLQTPSR